jgi:HSP20 family protein
VQRWDPFREFEQLQDEMGRLLEAVSSPGYSNGGAWIPQADIEETEDAWIVEAELPGVKRKDVNVEVRDGELLVSGEIKERERKGILRHRTRQTGEFEIRVTLPGDVDTDRVDASIDDGILTVEIPKPQRAKPRKVEVGAHENGSSAEGD